VDGLDVKAESLTIPHNIILQFIVLFVVVASPTQEAEVSQFYRPANFSNHISSHLPHRPSGVTFPRYA